MLFFTVIYYCNTYLKIAKPRARVFYFRSSPEAKPDARIWVKVFYARDDPGSAVRTGEVIQGGRDCTGLPDPPSGLKHLFSPSCWAYGWQELMVSGNCLHPRSGSLLGTEQCKGVYVPAPPP